MIYTFGDGHECPQCNLSLRRCYVELPDRGAMVGLYGVKWAHEYNTPEAAGVERFGLQRVVPGACACGGHGRAPWVPPT